MYERSCLQIFQVLRYGAYLWFCQAFVFKLLLLSVIHATMCIIPTAGKGKAVAPAMGTTAFLISVQK